MDKTQTGKASPGVQRAAQVVVGGAGLVLLACWGLASMTSSLAVYAAGWVAAVSAASAAALLYRLWTAGQPDLQQRTQTMTLGLVGWLIVIGGCMTLFRAAASVFMEEELTNMELAVWLLPVALLLSVAVWGVCWRAGQATGDARLQSHAAQHLATVAALAIAEAGLVVAQLGDEVVRWPDVLAGVLAVGAGMAWSWIRLWKRIGASRSTDPVQDGGIDPALSTKAREALDAAQGDGTIAGYDRLALEPSPAGARITVRLHVDGELALHEARDRARQVERALEALMPSGVVDALLEPAAGGAAAEASPAIPAEPPAPAGPTADEPRDEVPAE